MHKYIIYIMQVKKKKLKSASTIVCLWSPCQYGCVLLLSSLQHACATVAVAHVIYKNR